MLVVAIVSKPPAHLWAWQLVIPPQWLPSPGRGPPWRRNAIRSRRSKASSLYTMFFAWRRESFWRMHLPANVSFNIAKTKTWQSSAQWSTIHSRSHRSGSVLEVFSFPFPYHASNWFLLGVVKIDDDIVKSVCSLLLCVCIPRLIRCSTDPGFASRDSKQYDIERKRYCLQRVFTQQDRWRI